MPTTLEEALIRYQEEEPRGAYVIVIEGVSLEDKKKEKMDSWQEMSIEKHMDYYERDGIDHKDAMKLVAKDRGISKREVYQYLIKNS